MDRTSKRPLLGSTDIAVPKLIFGSSALGNLYKELDTATKRKLVREWLSGAPTGDDIHDVTQPDGNTGAVCIDSAGKYGAGLALEEIGRGLREAGASAERVIISNKLGWRRIPLEGEEPTFEPGVWKNLEYDAEQSISYDGIISCWEQGNALLGEGFTAELLSVHDPDEYLAAASDDSDRARRFGDVIDAYRALIELRNDGQAKAIGIGSKDWQVIREISDKVELDWIMFAGSLTVYTHPRELRDFIRDLATRGVYIINSAVFNAGFLVGGAYFDYRAVTPEIRPGLFAWRESFLSICQRFAVNAADVCVEFGLAPSGVSSVAMNTTRPERVADNVRAVESRAPSGFWDAMKTEKLIEVTPAEM